MPPLVPCPACRRHVQCSESACPFCAAVLPRDLDQTLVPMPQRERGMSPVWAPAVIAAVAAATIGCSATATKYGAPPPPPPEDAGTHAQPLTAPQDTPLQAPAPAYGAPPPMPPTKAK